MHPNIPMVSIVPKMMTNDQGTKFANHILRLIDSETDVDWLKKLFLVLEMIKEE